MIKKALGVTLCVLLVVAATGCAKLQSGDSFAGLDLTAEGMDGTHYNGKNWGIYLLWIPLITGDTDNPNGFLAMSFLTDNVNVDAVGEMIADEAAADGATALEDLNSWVSGFPVLFPPTLFYRSVGMSANGVQ